MVTGAAADPLTIRVSTPIWLCAPGARQPIPTATTPTVLAAFIEFLGGCAMIVGFLARPAAVGIIVVMLVAIAKVHGKHGFFLNLGVPGKGPGYEFNFVLIAMALSILIGGAGILSVDRALWLALGGAE